MNREDYIDLKEKVGNDAVKFGELRASKNNKENLKLHESREYKQTYDVRILDIEIYNDYGEHTWAQEKYLVHGYDDVMWTSDLDGAMNFFKEQIKLLEKEVFRK